MSFLLLKRVCRGNQCAEDFKELMEITGWSQEVLYAVFFSGIFLLLLLIVFVLHRFETKKQKNKYKKGYKPKKKFYH
jgi:uncharacterized integral membrane protein